MVRRRTRWARALGVGLAVAGLGGPSDEARAQAPPVAGATGSATTRGPGFGANPFTSPYANPYMNPLMTQQQMSPEQAALYFLAARQSSGGVGSGKLGGPNSVLGAPAGEAGARRPGRSNAPGARASTFFNRSGPRTAGTSSYYNRQTKHFPENGR